jgi:hypothetical protein
MEQSKTWKGALLASTSLLALGVPMASEGWQLRGIRYLDMWEQSYSEQLLIVSNNGKPVYPDAKRLKDYKHLHYALTI